MTQDPNNLIWLDLEMTGLDTVNDEIIEIATIVTDADLNILAEGPVIAVRQSEALLDGMDEWNQKQHGGSGLIARVRESEHDEATAEAETLAFLQQYVPAGASPMCGNSICQDRRFMSRTMPKLEDYFHYRNLDVSTLKELAKRWAPDMADGFTKESKHLAIDDIRDSIAELKFYRDNFLRLS
ncbi:MAG: oligoribonuclease [Gammaproteobacteria bacterium (ex Lamellibrachia satsuma)]|nr:MAG: oligoribonuclease [Gammaproteobacteria bacterium (ex Lamellibrachia satsuma)]RRS34781.1 MAG: oligoribonuclease [Gammaproteobacteria bacterium (ex Lamellibrachia satsuma)]RRS34862.1 MAG: oligoribonuclease [Gammaproteobacteria bacterium (ex Lamellibrachia satsuma)]